MHLPTKFLFLLLLFCGNETLSGCGGAVHLRDEFQRKCISNSSSNQMAVWSMSVEHAAENRVISRSKLLNQEKLWNVRLIVCFQNTKIDETAYRHTDRETNLPGDHSVLISPFSSLLSEKRSDISRPIEEQPLRNLMQLIRFLFSKRGGSSSFLLFLLPLLQPFTTFPTITTSGRARGVEGQTGSHESKYTSRGGPLVLLGSG